MLQISRCFSRVQSTIISLPKFSGIKSLRLTDLPVLILIVFKHTTMSNFSPELALYLKYATPPVVGALIGYLTNRVAIRMLFRPLVAWKVGKMRVPMTPGVIPSKREDLAFNMGEVVGDHLLTSAEVGQGLQHEVFQKHLFNLISTKIKNTLGNDLGPVSDIIPPRYKVYVDIGTKTVSHQINSQVADFLRSKQFESNLSMLIDKKLDSIARKEVASILPNEKRDQGYLFLEESITRMFNSEPMGQWIDDFVHQKVFGSLQQQKSLKDVLPDSLPPLFTETIEKQIPVLLQHLANMVGEPDIRDRVVKGACAGVEKFIDSLGSMADMVRGFLRMEMVEEKIREYLIEKNDDIVSWLQSGEVHDKFVSIIRQKSDEFINRPIIEWVKEEDENVIEEFCQACTKQILLMIRGEEVATTFASMIKSNLENHIDSGSASIQTVLNDLLGSESLSKGREWLKQEILNSLQSTNSLNAFEIFINSMLDSLLEKRIGKLSRFVPEGVVEGVAQSIQKQASNMLESEVPGLVHSLNIRRIVTEKINSLDLLRLEGLLLSIMEEQFKYINLFGALLGFLIGCINLFVLYSI